MNDEPPQRPSGRRGPSAQAARDNYRRLAASYDRRVARVGGYRRRALVRLDAQADEVVLDVACGTGLSFASLAARLGPEGTIVGIEQSLEMLGHARRVQEAGWSNVTLIHGRVEAAPIPVTADAALFVLTHDVLRSPAAIANVLAAVRPGGRVVAAGSKWFSRWLFPANAYMWLKAGRFVTTFEGFDQPWTLLADAVPDLRVQTFLAGGGYLAWGTLADDRQRPPHPLPAAAAA